MLALLHLGVASFEPPGCMARPLRHTTVVKVFAAHDRIDWRIRLPAAVSNGSPRA